MQVIEFDLDGSACIRCKYNTFKPVCAELQMCKPCKKSRNSHHARKSAERKRERTRRLKREAAALDLENAKAASELELAKAEKQYYKLQLENMRQKYAEYIMKQWPNNTISLLFRIFYS